MNIIKLGSKNCSWIIPANHITNESVVYCAGAGEDIQFEVDLANKYGCHVHIFDPTPRAKIHFDKRKDYYKIENDSLLHFHEIGLHSKKCKMKFYEPKIKEHVSHSINPISNEFIQVNFNSLKNIMKELKHKQIDFLKMDIEGSEYPVIENMIQSNIDVKAICVEYHAEINTISGFKQIAKEGTNLTFVKE